MKKHKARDDLTEMFSFFGYHLLSPLLPTRVTSKTNSCIDHIWGNIGINISCIHRWGPADHFMIKVSISMPKLVRRYKETFSFAFLLQSKWKEVDGTLSDLDKSAGKFSEIILSCIDRFAPSQTRYVPKNNKSWVTKEVKKVANKKAFAYRTYIKKPYRR